MDDAAGARRLHAAGDVDAADALYRRALAAAPDDALLRRDYGALLLQAGRPREAIPLLRGALESGLADVGAATMLALALRGEGDIPGGREAARRALALDPREPLALLAAGSLAVLAGEPARAESWLRASVAAQPALLEAWHWLGEALQAQERWHEAAAAYGRAMAGHPGEALNIGICAERAGDLAAARAAYLRAHAAMPARADVLVRLAQVEALACRFGDSRRHADGAAAILRRGALERDDRPEPFPLSWLQPGDDAMRVALQRQAERVLAHASASAQAPLRPRGRSPALASGPRRRVRLGYLSADFGPHAVGSLLERHFAAHDRERFEVHGYSLRRHDGPVAEAIRAGFDAFHDCAGLASDAIAGRIRDDGVDVLFDLGGYTAGARPGILALRPCAVQLGWLGFFHGHEAPWLDGLVLDDHVQPGDAAWPWADRVLRLDTLVLPAGPMPSGRADRAAFGLPDGVPVLASFNNSYKLDEALVAAWARILEQVPDAHLLVYLPESARAGFLDAWARHGGDAARLHPCDHLPASRQADRAASCDLFLDAFRYQAGATGIAAVATGLPLLARRGEYALARLGAGLNGFLGLDELVCDDTADYIARAIALARDRETLARLRARTAAAVEARRLLDPRRGAAAIERLVARLLPEAARP